MVDRVDVEGIIQKALEGRLYDAKANLRAIVPEELRSKEPYSLTGDIFPIWWPNLSFYDKKGESDPPVYCRFTFHPSPRRFRTGGENPRIWYRGHALIGCFSPQGAGEAVSRALRNVILDAFPVTGPESAISKDGIDTHVENVDPKSAFGNRGRWYLPVHINYNCWRAET